MSEFIRVADEWYILASSALAETRTHVLKDGETFAIFNHAGDVIGPEVREEGIFHEGTRYLSRLEVLLNAERPVVLSSLVKQESENLIVDLTNPDQYTDGELSLPRDSFHVFRSKYLWRGACHESIRIKNYLPRKSILNLEFRFDADFADIFEVRGQIREKRGRILPAVIEADSVTLAYRGLDNVIRSSRLRFSQPPASLTKNSAVFEIALDTGEEWSSFLTLTCLNGNDTTPVNQTFHEGFNDSVALRNRRHSEMCRVTSSNEQFNDWVNSSVADVLMMATETGHGLYPYAGIPWFNTVFGRDGIIAALQCLWIMPELAKGVLLHLASLQSRELDPSRDAEPGKIPHELRKGEMANLGEVPFGRYYGSVDVTPLFIVLAGEYYQATGDLKTIETIWDAILLSLEWIDLFGDVDGDGFVEYHREAEHGLEQQGWKDSSDSVFHADGLLATGPIALCEVQGYVYAAKMAGSTLAGVRHDHTTAAKLLHEAEELREAFDAAFWCEEIGTFALALDGEKRPCSVRTSNPGHCLYTGIVTEARAQQVAESLFSRECYSGWGFRTVSSQEHRYNPISYHNGSVWPHDTALIAQGLARYGMRERSLVVLAGLMDASIFMELHRLPELFCGFQRRPGEGPTLYPVACAPQAWAVGAIFMMLQACLGLSLHQPEGRIVFLRPRLPTFIDSMRLENLRLGGSSVDLLLNREKEDVGVIVENRRGEMDTVVVK